MRSSVERTIASLPPIDGGDPETALFSSAVRVVEDTRLGLPSLDGLGVVSDVIAFMAERRPDVQPALRTWTALTLCGAVMGTKVYATPWGRALRPNLNLVIVAPSGAGKGDTLGDAEELFEAAVPDHLLPDRFSSAGWNKALGKAQGWGLAVVDEGDELLKRTKMDAFADIIGLLCRSYDGRVAREAIISREDDAPRPSAVAPTLMIAIQPSALQAGILETTHVLSGLIGRCVMVSVERPKRRVLLNETGGVNLQPRAVKGLQAMSRIVGWTRIGDAARPSLQTLQRLVELDEPSDELAGSHARVSALAVKLATILQASLQADDGRGGAPDPVGSLAMSVGRDLAWSAWTEMKRVFGQDVSYDRAEAKLQRVLRVMRKHGGVDVVSGDVLRGLSGVSARDLDGMLATLEARGQVHSIRRTSPKGGAPARLLSIVEETGS